jgi:hypothetical protein
MESYAVLWSEPSEPVEAGKLELEAKCLRFEGSGGTRRAPHVHRVEYAEIEAVHVGRDSPERLGGRPALVLDLVTGGPLRIGSIAGVGLLSELAERLSSVCPPGVAA